MRVNTQVREAFGNLERTLYVCSANMIKVYDGFRATSAEISSFGYGNSEHSLGIFFKGFELSKFMPPGLGEPCRNKQRIYERIERAKTRKRIAEEQIRQKKIRQLRLEQERIRLENERLEQIQHERDEEELSLFTHAFESLFQCTPSTDDREKARVMRLWNNLYQIKLDRYEFDLPHAPVSRHTQVPKHPCWHSM